MKIGNDNSSIHTGNRRALITRVSGVDGLGCN